MRDLSLRRPGKYNSVFDLFHLCAPELVVPVDGVRAAILYTRSLRLTSVGPLGSGAGVGGWSAHRLQCRSSSMKDRGGSAPPPSLTTTPPLFSWVKKGKGVREKTLLLNSNRKGVRTASVELLEHCIHLQDEKAGRRGRKRESERGAFLSEPTRLTKRKGRRWSKRKSSLLSIKLD